MKGLMFLLLGLMVMVGMVKAEGGESPRVVIETSKGNFIIALDAENAPASTENFLKYAEGGFYDGTVFHRVIDGFMIQGGGFTEEMSQKQTRGTIQNEADNGIKNRRGTVAMARRPDPHSATAQFFVNLVDNAPLDHRSKDAQGWGYAVFGEVVEGMDVVDAIGKVKTGRHGAMGDVPTEAVIIEKAYVEEGAAAE